MSAPPRVAPRKSSGLRVMMPPGERPPPGSLSIYTVSENGAHEDSNHTTQQNAEREVEILNHCFDDVERFMGRLQQTAEAQSVLDQRRKKSRKSKKKTGPDGFHKNYSTDYYETWWKDVPSDDLLTMKASPPSEEDFLDVFQKIKYSLSLLDRLKSSISQPDASDLLHHIFLPLRLMVKTTGGPALAASVVGPAMTSGAVSLLQEHLAGGEKELWTSLGSNWTSSCSHLDVSAGPYSPVFLDGWQSQAYDSAGQPLEDPIALQHKQDALRERNQPQTLQKPARQASEGAGEGTDEVDGNGLPPEGERFYCCSYDFVARNSTELSVLQGETLEVVESAKRWWKCRNRFDQIGFVPHNILEPLSALNNTGRDNPLVRRESRIALSPPANYFSFPPSSPDGTSPNAASPTTRPQSGEESDRVLIINDELLQRLAGRKESVRPPVAPRTPDTSTSLNYRSPPAEVEAWLTAKGFNQQTIRGLGILTGAQLFTLNKEELRLVAPEDGARVYSQIMVQKTLLEDVHKATELEAVMEKQKQKIGVKSEGGAF